MAGVSARQIVEWSKIDPWFIHQIEEIVDFEKRLKTATSNPIEPDLLLEANRDLAGKRISGKKITREKITVSVA